MSHQTPDSELRAIEASLKDLVPSSGGFDRDWLFYQAGRQADRSRLVWPGISLVLASALIALGAAWAFSPSPEPVERMVHVYLPGPAPEASAAPAPSTVLPSSPPALVASAGDFDVHAEGRYLRAREQALRWGVESLPPSGSFQRPGWSGLEESLWMIPMAVRRPAN